ncbi:MAG: FTR1 family protein [Woeseia sp.]
MLTTSVLIVLHEVLEAAFMVGALLALTRSLRMPASWALRSLLIGFSAALLYGYVLRQAATFFGGVGQEAINVTLQVVSCTALLICVYLGAREPFGQARQSNLLPIAMTTAVAAAVALEGSEIFVYVAGFIRADSSIASASIGSLAGLCIGISIGVLFYHLLQLLSPSKSRVLILFFIILVGTGMSAQATRELIQAHWLVVGNPLWDSSWLLPEESILGHVLYALGGYEATPTAVAVWIYAATLAIMIGALLLGRRFRH